MAQTWKQRYSGYALEKTKDTRNRAAEEVDRLREAGADPGDIERAEARLASWDELLVTYVKARKRERGGCNRTGLYNLLRRGRETWLDPEDAKDMAADLDAAGVVLPREEEAPGLTSV